MDTATATAETYFKPGTLGIGVGRLLKGIPERGEPDFIFQSTVWFPSSCSVEAQAFADEFDLDLRDGIAL